MSSQFKDDENSDSESDSDDDTAALLAELEKIKKERAEEQERKVCMSQSAVNPQACLEDLPSYRV